MGALPGGQANGGEQSRGSREGGGGGLTGLQPYLAMLWKDRDRTSTLENGMVRFFVSTASTSVP